MKTFLTGMCAAALMAATTLVGVAPSFAQATDNPGGNLGSMPFYRGGGEFRGDRGISRRDFRESRRDFRGDRREFRDARREFRRGDLTRRDFREARRDFRDERREFRGDRRDFRRGFYRDNRYGYYNGHRGYSYYRSGYREYNGYWFPLAAFAAGAVIGGVINDQPVRRVYRSNYGSAHVQWCYDRYRSYRASDNTFQPYNGGRQACYSPYS